MTNQISSSVEKSLQDNAENIALGMSILMGAKVVRKSDYDAIYKEKQDLLDKTKDIDKLKTKLIRTECKLLGFARYHRKWKPTTKRFEKKLNKLKGENVYVSFTDYPSDIAENLKESYNCYINGMSMACYIMILRTIEITVNLIYKQHNRTKVDDKGKAVFISAIQKLNWVKTEGMIGGADYTLAKAFIEARNDSIHELFIPSEKQVMSAFETVIHLVGKLKLNIKTKKK